MKQMMQKHTAWHLVGIWGERALDGQTAVSLAAPSVTLLKIDLSKCCGFRRKTRVINL